MTEEEQQKTESENNDSDLLGKMRDEMAAQLETYKKSFESELSALKSQNEQLMKDNKTLQQTLVHSATLPPQKTEQPKSEEQLYQERIDALAEKSKKIMEMY